MRIREVLTSNFRILERVSRRSLVARLLVGVILLSLGVHPSFANECRNIYSAIARGDITHVIRHYRNERTYWSNYVRGLLERRRERRQAVREGRLPFRIRMGNAYQETTERIGGGIRATSESLGNYGRALREAPLETTGNSAWWLAQSGTNILLAGPRFGWSLLKDIGSSVRTGLREWWQTPGILPKIPRAVVRPRDDLSGAPFRDRFFDAAGDPVSALLQRETPRRVLQTLWGRPVPAPPVKATMLASAGVYGTLGYYLVWKRIYDSNKRDCVEAVTEMREKSNLGIEHLDKWMTAGVLTDACDIQERMLAQATEIEQWRKGFMTFHPNTIDLLRTGVLGDITKEEWEQLKSVIELLDSEETRRIDIENKMDALSENAKLLFVRLDAINLRLRNVLNETIADTKTMEARIAAGTLTMKDHIPFIEMYRQKWQAALDSSPDFVMELVNDPIRKHHLLGALNPRVEVNGKTDFEWIRYIETGGASEFSEPIIGLHKQALVGIYYTLAEWRKEANPHPLSEAWAVEMVSNMDGAIKTHERFERSIASVNAELIAVDEEITTNESRIAQGELGTAEQARIARRNMELRGNRLQIEQRARRLQARRDRSDLIYARIQAAKEIPDFCMQENCGDQLQTLMRPEIPPFTAGMSYYPFGIGETPPIELKSELDFWKLAFDDPLFLEYALDKAQNASTDLDLLRSLSRRIEAYSELFVVQGHVFSTASLDPAKINELQRVPDPPPYIVCALMGEISGPTGRTRINDLFYGAHAVLKRASSAMTAEKVNACRYEIGRELWNFFAIQGNISREYHEAIRELKARISDTNSIEYRSSLDQIRGDFQDRILRHRLSAIPTDAQAGLVDRVIEDCQQDSFELPSEIDLESSDCSSYIQPED